MKCDPSSSFLLSGGVRVQQESYPSCSWFRYLGVKEINDNSPLLNYLNGA